VSAKDVLLQVIIDPMGNGSVYPLRWSNGSLNTSARHHDWAVHGGFQPNQTHITASPARGSL
jgi:hypothetical protein